ncbi:protoporphyrinogen oxidase [Hymenobacter nivis]|uniref:Coproporphyrinogen III oxidase n=1 Tax=Hymenobacter nivis TaxID=1850093 RepID=A0A2Z3GGL6_9BACT|nr:protoporphyrinogen oxidase [Hymenobacter nivis]AWM32969.1 protoporphyrinogen oxidase [Hymenobacter nivis]
MKIALLGGGLAGLTCAWYLQQAGVAYDLFEADARPGGNLLSLNQPEGYLLEAGPNSLQLSPELAELFDELGLTDQVQDTAAVGQRRYVLRGGSYRELPGSPPALLASSFFSLKGKWRLLREFLKPAGAPNPDETVAAFFTRRFGSEIVDYAVNPFVAGIYAGDPAQLLLRHTFPQLAALEQAHGSVLRGLAKAGKGVGRRRVVTLQGGVQVLTDALAARLTHCHPGAPIAELARAPDGAYSFQAGGATQGPYTHLVLALPAYAAAPLLAGLFPAAAAALAAVHYPPMAVVYSAYERAAVAHPLEGFGALHPKAEGAYAAGSLWTSSLYPGRVPAGQVLFTTFVGGTQYEAAAQQPEADQKAAVHTELARFYGIAGAPTWQGRYYWPRSIPQFDAAIGPARASVEALRADGIVAVANWQAGVGVPDVVRHARTTAQALAAGAPAPAR